VSILHSAAETYVPKRRKGFFKFCCDAELKILKQDSRDSNQAWKAAGKPRFGPLYSRRQSCRLVCRKRIKEGQRINTEVYTNGLYEALLKKNNTMFWHCWHSKFDSNTPCNLVDGSVDADVIADKFASHFASVFSCNNPLRTDSIKQEYLASRNNYSGLPLNDSHTTDTELVSNVNLQLGKAADINGLSAENLSPIIMHSVVNYVSVNVLMLLHPKWLWVQM